MPLNYSFAFFNFFVSWCLSGSPYYLKNLRVWCEFSTHFSKVKFVSPCRPWRKIFLFFQSAQEKTCAFGAIWIQGVGFRVQGIGDFIWPLLEAVFFLRKSAGRPIAESIGLAHFAEMKKISSVST
jgi:hypothetical protein